MLDMILNVDGEEGQSIPLIVDSPHSGVIYPSDFNHQAEFSKLRQAEDSYVDELYNYVSEIGGVILNANFPRSYICLLYTSPSPRDRSLSRMPSSA